MADLYPLPPNTQFKAYAEARDALVIDLNALPFLDAPLRPAFVLSLLSVEPYLAKARSARRTNGSQFHLEIGYVDSASANAFASCHARTHLCGLNAGLAAQLFDLAFFVLAQKTTFQDVGQATGEAAPTGLHPSHAARWLGAAIAVEGVAALPRDAERHVLAEDLAQLMLRFVWLHEFYHCVNGHVGYLQQFDRDAALYEMPETDPALVTRQTSHIVSPLEFQLLEFDADRSAIWTMFQIQAHGMENIPSLAERTLADRQTLTLLAGTLMIVLFERAHAAAEGQGSATHPRPYFRLQNFLRTVASNVHDGLADMRPLFLALTTEMHALHAVLPGLPDIEVLHADLMSPAFQKPMDEAEDQLDRLREKLMPFRFEA